MLKALFPIAALALTSLTAAAQLRQYTTFNENGVILKVAIPPITDEDHISCFNRGVLAASVQFQRKYGRSQISVDEYKAERADRGGLTFTSRLSAQPRAEKPWVHQVYRVSTQFARGCTVGTVQVSNEYEY